MRSLSGASGGVVAVAGPNVGTVHNVGYATQSPRLDYTVTFPAAGRYFVWVRGAGLSRGDDTVHVGVNSNPLRSSDRISGFSRQLKWSNNTLDGTRATISVPTAGMHTVNVWMREDGFIFDKIALARSSNYVPSGQGPTTAALATALLSWRAPILNTDGTPITDLAGFVIYMATQGATFTANDIVATVPAIAPNGGSDYAHVVSDLRSGAYYFTVTAYNAAGDESRFSSAVSKTIPP